MSKSVATVRVAEFIAKQTVETRPGNTLKYQLTNCNAVDPINGLLHYRLRPWRAIRILPTAVVIGVLLTIVGGLVGSGGGLLTSVAFAQRNLKDIPAPDPSAELAAMQIGEGFEVNLYASNQAYDSCDTN